MLASTEEKALLRYLYLREENFPEERLVAESLSETELKKEGLPVEASSRWQNLERILHELDEIDSTHDYRFGFYLYGDARSSEMQGTVRYLMGLKLIAYYSGNPHVILTPRGKEFGRNLRFTGIIETAIEDWFANVAKQHEKS